MSTKINSTWRISGVIDTNKAVMSNIDTISMAAGAWTTFDVNQGKWAVVINSPGASVKSFNDSNIIGSISVSSTGLTELYNAVQVEYPHKDLLDQTDTITYSINSANRYNNERDNILNFQIDCVNEPAQVEALAIRELKQGRIDKVIKFRTDFSSLGLKAGDIIDVTASMYGFSAKKFRILSIQEDDGDDNVLSLGITAFEYDEGIYNISEVTRELRTSTNNIVAKSCNTAIKASDNQANLPLDLSGVATALGLLLTFNALTGRWELSQSGQQVVIDGDNAIIKWTFVDGQDLDIRCAVVYPNIGQNTLDDYIGYTGTGNSNGPANDPYTDPISGQTVYQFPSGSTAVWPPQPAVPILIWGGDNTGTGEETVLVNLLRLKELFPGEQYFIVECRGNWFGTPGAKPVRLDAEIYQGGDITPPSGGNFNWTVSNYQKARYIQGLDIYLDSNFGGSTVGGFNGENAPGDLLGYFIFEPYTNTAYFRNDLTGL